VKKIKDSRGLGVRRRMAQEWTDLGALGLFFEEAGNQIDKGSDFKRW